MLPIHLRALLRQVADERDGRDEGKGREIETNREEEMGNTAERSEAVMVNAIDCCSFRCYAF
jgi:hypothetical protein